MIPADILLVLILVLILVVPFAVLARLGARIAAKRARLVEPETQGDDGGWPIDARGYPTMLPKSMADYGPYEAALERFFAGKAED